MDDALEETATMIGLVLADNAGRTLLLKIYCSFASQRYTDPGSSLHYGQSYDVALHGTMSAGLPVKA